MNEIFKKTNIDCTVPGPIKLGDIPIDCLTPSINMLVKQKQNAGNGLTISIGTNAPEYDNVVCQELVWEVQENRSRDFPSSSSYPGSLGKIKLNANDELYLNIVTPADGTMVADFYGHGFDL